MRTLVAGLLLAVTLAACSGSSTADLPRPSREFCEAANQYEELIQQAPPPSVDSQIELLEEMAANAPSDIRADTNTFLDALRQVEDDPSLRDDPQVEEAVDNVNRRAANGCGFFKRDSGSGL